MNVDFHIGYRGDEMFRESNAFGPSIAKPTSAEQSAVAARRLGDTDAKESKRRRPRSRSCDMLGDVSGCSYLM